MTQTATTKVTLVVDGNNLLMRSIKVAEGRVALSADGVWTAPLLIFINTLARYVKDTKPTAVTVFWDGGASDHRLAIYPEYKGDRRIQRMLSAVVNTEVQTDDLFALAVNFLTYAGVPTSRIVGAEADDCIAAYCWGREAHERVVILSGDKDMLQLLDGWVEQIRPGGGDERWTANRVRSEMQCKPTDLPNVMALTGDSGDGVPGVPGIGHKTACKLLARHNWSLEELLNANDEPKVYGCRSAIERNHALVNLLGNPAGVVVDRAPIFRPVTFDGSLAGDQLGGFLDRYELASIKTRIAEGTLWSTPVAGRPPKRPASTKADTLF